MILNRTLRDIGIIITVALGSALIVYLPFLLNILPVLGFSVSGKGMEYIYQNFDGLLYIVPAKTGYVPAAITTLRLETDLPPAYFAAHLPLYPLLIAFFIPIMGALKSMLFVAVMSSVGMSVVFYLFISRLKLTDKPLFLTCVLLLFPRLFITRVVGAPEPLFLMLIIASIWMFEEKKYMWAGLIGGLAAMTKVPGILLFPAYIVAYWAQHSWKWHIDSKKIVHLFSLSLIPGGLLAVFSYYAFVYGDFFAYFHTGGVVPMPYPFSVFHANAKWVGTHWLEDVMLLFILYTIAVVQLRKTQSRSLYYFSLIFLGVSFFVQHRDLSRYMLPIVPFVLIAYESVLTKKTVVIALCILLPALFLYTLNFLTSNILPVSDWRPYL